MNERKRNTVSVAMASVSTNSGLSMLERELTYNYYFRANRREWHYHRFSAFNELGHIPKILKWYGAKMGRNPDCVYC